MNSGQKFPDYVVLWNCGAGIAYVFGSGLALITCLEHFSGIQSSYLINPNTTFGQEFALSIIALLLSVTICVLNMMYAQHYFRHKDARVSIGFAATIGFLVLVGFQLCRSVSEIATYNGSNHFGATEGVIKLLDVAIWGILGFDVINATMGALSFWHVFRNGEVAREIYVQKNGVVEEGEHRIAAEVADHAMGRPKPSPEKMDEEKSRNVPNQELNDPIDSPLEERKKAEEKEKAERFKSKKKELPPILSANPDNDMLGKINRDDHTLKIGKPILADEAGARSEEAYQQSEPKKNPEPVYLPEPEGEKHEEHHEEHHHEERHHDEKKPEYESEDTLPVDRSDDY